jgi:isoquinoline 1-oxidoreductase subunit beta
MKTVKTTYNRRSFLKASALSGGGMLLGISWLSSTKAVGAPTTDLTTGVNAPAIWNELNGFVQITPDNVIRIMSPNPEGGQGVKTSMPMLVAEELDADWQTVVIEQAGLDTKHFTRQFIGGSQAIRMAWKPLRTAGATARQMLRQAAANAWNVPLDEVTTKAGVLLHAKSGKSATYGAMATAAAALPVPKEVSLKAVKDFTLIGRSQKNVDGLKIVTGKPLYGIDTQRPGMLIAMIVHPPAIGMKLKAVNDAAARKMPGIHDVFPVKLMQDDYERTFFDTAQFPEVVAVVGNSTWEVMQAKKALKIDWEPFSEYTESKSPPFRRAWKTQPRTAQQWRRWPANRRPFGGRMATPKQLSRTRPKYSNGPTPARIWRTTAWSR